MNKVYKQYINYIVIDVLEELNIYPHDDVVGSIENILQKYIKNIKNNHRKHHDCSLTQINGT